VQMRLLRRSVPALDTLEYGDAIFLPTASAGIILHFIHLVSAEWDRAG